MTIKEKQLVYLDKLQESGRTNMFGAGPYLQRDWGLTRAQACAVLEYWMETYEERHPE